MGIGMKTSNNNARKQGTVTQKPKQEKSEQERLKSRPRKYDDLAKKNVRNNYSSFPDETDFIEEENEDFTATEKQNENSSLKKGIIIGIVILVIILFFVIGFLMLKSFNISGDSQGSDGVNTEKTLEKDSDGDLGEVSDDSLDGYDEGSGDEVSSEASTEEQFRTGDSNLEGEKYEEGVLTKTTPEHYSSTDFLKDLNGYDIPAVYTVQNITYDVAHVNYQSKRATIDDGMEFYWLEIDYNGKKYRAQCSYNMFRQLESEGICKVALEILTLDTGQQVISYMKVVPEEYTVEDAENDYNF